MAWHWQWRLLRACSRCCGDVLANLCKANIWQPMLKNVLATTIAIVIAVVPRVVQVYGKYTFLAPMTAVFSQPGQRFGKMVETLFLIALGALLGLGWSNLGLYLSSLVYDDNKSAAWSIRAVFFFAAAVIHGVLRSSAPRLFQLVLFFILVSLIMLTSTETAVDLSAIKGVIYPIFTAIGVVTLVNVLVFPRFSSGFLGTSTIETLAKTVDSFQKASDWFMSNSKDGGDEEKTSMRTRFTTLTAEKSNLRVYLNNCKAAQAECNFELVLAVLPPVSLKPISVNMMTRLVQVTISLINACESKFALAAYDEKTILLSKKASDDDDSDMDSSPYDVVTKQQHDIDLIKPLREMESGDIDVLEQIMSQIRPPAKEMCDQIRDAVRIITAALAYCYDVSPSRTGPPKPHGILLKEMDIRMGIFTDALAKFDVDSAAALEVSAATDEHNLTSNVAPRMETHLAASFLISISQAARHVLQMMHDTRKLIETRENRHGRLKLYWPRITWKKWLVSGGEQDRNVLPENARKPARAGYGPIEDSKNEGDATPGDSTQETDRQISDEELGATEAKHEIRSRSGFFRLTAGIVGKFRNSASRVQEKIERASNQENILRVREVPVELINFASRAVKEIPDKYSDLKKLLRTTTLKLRGLSADAVEFFLDSDHLKFSLKMTIAALLVTWPAFVPTTNAWYISVRGTWATLQLILVFEVSVGTSLRGFVLRAVGSLFGCTIGLLAWEIGQGNLVALVFILALGLIPGSYIQLATPYVKAGVISMISLAVVGITSADAGRGGDVAWETYLKRLICFLIGGTVALLVEMTLFPVRARDRLVESLASTISQVSIMQSSVAVGVDSPNAVDMKSHALNTSLQAKEKAEQALDAARTFLPFCLTEPRMKGTFRGQELVYREMIYVLFQIIERMDNMVHIRRLFGSTILEDFHAEILPYRRNLAGCVSLTLFAVQEALITKLPLPQFLPSSRVAVLRYVARTRALVLAREQEASAEEDARAPSLIPTISTATNIRVSKSMARQDFLAWKATSAGMIEIVEYLEELVDLAKLLIGVSAFRSGLLEHEKFKQKDAAMTTALETDTTAPVFGKIDSTRSKQGRGFRQRLTSFARRPSIVPRVPVVTRPRRSSVAVAALRRQVTVNVSSAVIDDEEFYKENDIPWSLQGVIKKRVLESDIVGQPRRRVVKETKGKNVLRNVRTT